MQIYVCMILIMEQFTDNSVLTFLKKVSKLCCVVEKRADKLQAIIVVMLAKANTTSISNSILIGSWLFRAV